MTGHLGRRTSNRTEELPMLRKRRTAARTVLSDSSMLMDGRHTEQCAADDAAPIRRQF